MTPDRANLIGARGDLRRWADFPNSARPVTTERRILGFPGAALLAAALCALVNGATIAAFRLTQAGKTPLSTGLQVHLFDLAHVLTLGLVVAALTALWRRFGPARPLWGRLAALLVAVPLGWPFLDEDLAGPTERLVAQLPAAVDWAVYGLLVAVVSMPVPVLGMLAGKLNRGWLRLLPLTAGLASMVVNHLILKSDYPGAHLAVASAGVLLVTGACLGLPLPGGRRLHFGAAGFAVALGLGGLFLRPSNTALVTQDAVDGSPLVSFLARVHLDDDEGPGEIPDTPWFKSRAKVKPTPASQPRLVPDDAVLIYFSADSVRADLFTRDAPEAKRFPEITRLRDESVWFSAARAPGAQTVYTLSAIFAGTYFSQQYWTLKKAENVASLWPWEDKTVRFPALLQRKGVKTVNFCQAEWGQGAYGLVRGFTEDVWVKPKPGSKWSTGQMVTDAIVARLKKHTGGPLFIFTHNLDPHAPFDLATRTGPNRDRWLAEVELVDKQLGQIRAALLETGLDAKAVIVFGADHGEGWGEHGTHFHGQNLYDEQVRVPLMIRVPGVAPREVDTPVSLIDLGPTFLDLMGAPTPAQFMGQSLVPFLRGQTPTLTRPIIAEGRMKQFMILGDGFKVLRDQRSGSLEIYDLTRDPGELDNLYDDLGAEGKARMAVLKAFFETHKIRKKGYKIPFRR